jgi:transposase
VDFLPDSGEDCRESGENMTKTTPPEPHTGLQGEGGFGRHQGREDAGRAGAAFRRSSEPDHGVEGAVARGAAGVFGSGASSAEAAPAVDLKALHAKIGELTLENDFLEGALGKAGLLSAKR